MPTSLSLEELGGTKKDITQIRCCGMKRAILSTLLPRWVCSLSILRRRQLGAITITTALSIYMLAMNQTTGNGTPVELFNNKGGVRFVDRAQEVGVDNVGYVKGVAWGDYDNDGDIDLFLSRMGQVNALYRNEGEAGFRELSATAGVEKTSMEFSNLVLTTITMVGSIYLSVGTTMMRSISLLSIWGRPHRHLVPCYFATGATVVSQRSTLD